MTPQDRRWFQIAFVLHLCAAIFSLGYLATDEHFQILEFLNYKWGFSPASDLAVEFGLHARPFLQVALYAIVAAPFRALGALDPFLLAMLLRAASAMLGLFALMQLARTARERSWIADSRLAAWIAPLSALLWFMPALHARTSQENVGGALLALGLAYGLRGGSRRYVIWAGTLLWASAEIRYQLLAAALPVAAALIFWGHDFSQANDTLWKNETVPRAFDRFKLLALGALGAFFCARIMDHWGYGTWTFPFVHYFEYNFLNQKLLTKVPLIPWDYYRSITTETWPLLGPVVIALFTLAWLQKSRHPVAVATAPLFLVHSFIAYKEFRFILPLAHFAPVLMPLALDGLNIFGPGGLWSRRWVRGGAAFLIGWNLLALAVTTLTPARPPLRIYEILSREALRESTKPFYIYTPDRDAPFRVLGLMMNFYRPRNLVEVTDITRVELEKRFHDPMRKPVWVYTRKESTDRDGAFLAQHCEIATQSPPQAVTNALSRAEFLHPYIPPSRIGRSILWRCRDSK